MRRRSVFAFVFLLSTNAAMSACGLVVVGSREPAEGGVDASVAEDAPPAVVPPDGGDAGADVDASPCGSCPPGFECSSAVCVDRGQVRFGVSANPSGNWTYGWRAVGAPGTAIVAYTYPFVDLADAGIEGWARDDAGPTPGVFRNPSGAVVHPYGTFTMAPGEMAFHPGSLGENSVVRWVAPSPGSFRATVAVRGLSGYGGAPPTTTGVTVLKGAAIVGSTQLATLDAGAEIAVPVSSFAQGDTLDVRVDDGTDQNYFYDSTGVDITVFAL